MPHDTARRNTSGSFVQCAEWAHLAAPYVHPRLAAVAHRHTNADGRPAKPIVNVYIHGNPRPEGAGPLSDPGDDIPDRRYFDDLVVARSKDGPRPCGIADAQMTAPLQGKALRGHRRVASRISKPATAGCIKKPWRSAELQIGPKIFETPPMARRGGVALQQQRPIRPPIERPSSVAQASNARE